MPDSSYEGAVRILIEFGLDDAKAREALQSIDMLKAAAGQTGGAFEELGKHEQGAGIGLEHLIHNHRALHMIMHSLGATEVPGLSQALMACFYGPIGGIMAAAVAVGMFRKYLGEAHKAANEFAEETSKGAFASAFKEVAAVIDTAREKTEAYAISISQIAQHEVTIAQALASQLAYMNALAAAREAATKAAEAARKADIERREKAGEITPEVAAIGETSDAVKAAQKDLADKRQKQQDDINEKQKAMDAANSNQAALDADKRAKDEAEKVDAAHRKSLERFAPSDENRKVHQDIVDEKAKAEKALEDLRTASIRGEARGMAPENPQAFKDAQERLQIANQKLIAYETGERKYAAENKPEAKDESDRIKAAAKQADERAEENRKEAEKLRRDIEDAKEIANDPAIRAKQDAELASKIAEIMSNAVSKLYAMPRGQEVESGIAIADIVEGGDKTDKYGQKGSTYGIGHITSQQQLYMMELVKALGMTVTNSTTLKQAADFLEKYKDNANAFFGAVLNLTNQGFLLHQQQLDKLSVTIGALNSATALNTLKLQAIAAGNGQAPH